MKKQNNKPEEIKGVLSGKNDGLDFDETVQLPEDRLPEPEKTVWDIMTRNIVKSRLLGGHTLAKVVIFKKLFESDNGLKKTEIIKNIMTMRDGVYLVLKMEGTGLFILGGRRADEVSEGEMEEAYRTHNHVSEFLQFSELIEKTYDVEEKGKPRKKFQPPQQMAG